jgi:hypothetical protein
LSARRTIHIFEFLRSALEAHLLFVSYARRASSDDAIQ